MKQYLPYWTSKESGQLGNDVFVAQHRLAESGFFSESALIDIIDHYAEEDLGISSMGTEPCHPQDWCEGSAGDLSGEELMLAVRNGRIWLNLRRVLEHRPEINQLVNDLYQELESKCPGLKTFNRSANLLVSSPSAIVYYHMDCPFNMLWHIAGKKRVWAYPTSSQFLSERTREDVLFGASTEEIHYLPGFDESAIVRDLEPGEMITWPLHSPHRVVNTEGVNISLSTEHYTKGVLRQNNVYLANRYFRTWHSSFARNTKVEGPTAWVKENAIRVVRRIPGLAPESPKANIYPKSFVVDLDAENCTRFLDSKNQPEQQPVLV